jgi:methylenetetrahydrofolate reductase (NADPH)
LQYGELSDSHFFRTVEGSKEDLLTMWGEAPITPADIFDVFAKYVEGRIPILPWCESALSGETVPLTSKLASINRAGFLSINSQPAVNGAKSTHPIYGWGGVGGRVYQKAYIEFFVSPQLLKAIIQVCSRHPQLNFHAINSEKVEYSTGHKSVTGESLLPRRSSELCVVSHLFSHCCDVCTTALTWGVFPNREILQPTIFDHDSFVVWSEEVFQLWTKSWAALYDDETESAALLYDVRPLYDKLLSRC